MPSAPKWEQEEIERERERERERDEKDIGKQGSGVKAGDVMIIR
jgi:hypothetical protein